MFTHVIIKVCYEGWILQTEYNPMPHICLIRTLLRFSYFSYLFFKRDDTGVDLLQCEVWHLFGQGVTQLGQVAAEVGQKLAGNDQAHILIYHCKVNQYL